MPLERSDAILDLSDPNIVLGQRKRRPTERLLENGDPLACKKGRKVLISTDVTVSDGSADTDKLKPSSTSPSIPSSSQSTGPTDSAEDTNDEAIEVDDDGDDEGSEMEATDEDDDAELSTCLTTLFTFSSSPSRPFSTFRTVRPTSSNVRQPSVVAGHASSADF